MAAANIEEGAEMTVTISEVSEKGKNGDPLDITFGSWAGLIDAEKLKKDMYADRLASTRPDITEVDGQATMEGPMGASYGNLGGSTLPGSMGASKRPIEQ